MAKARKMPSGNYRVLVYVGKDADGNREYKSFTAHTAKEAEFAALEYVTQHKRSSAHKTMTLGDAMDKYISIKTAMLSPSSIATYKKLKRLYFQDLLQKPIAKITESDVQAEINKQAKTLSPKTVKSNHGFLSAVLKVYRNDFELNTVLPKDIKYVPNIPDADAIKIIMTEAKGTNIELPVLFALWLGMRMSEIRALKWEHVKKDRITIKEAIVDADNEAITKSTKSYAGTRTVYLPEYIQKLLESQPRTSEYVITMKRPTIYDNYVRLLERAGLPPSRFHDLRHANASIMLMLGIPDKYAMERIGHATTHTLKNVYQHTLDSQKQAMNTRMDDYFSGLMQHKMQHD